MPFATRLPFTDRQVVQYSNTSITLSGQTYVSPTVLYEEPEFPPCPIGFTLSAGTETCYKYTCPIGYTLSGSTCYSGATTASTITTLSGATGQTPSTLAGLTGYMYESNFRAGGSGLIVNPPILHLSASTGTTTVDVTGYVLKSTNSDGSAEWSPISGVSWSVSACTNPLYVTNIIACPSSAGTITVNAGELHIDGDIKITDGTQQAGYVLTTDASGVGTWQYNSTGFSGNTSGSCISDIHVSNIHSCSPLNINPIDEGNVYFGSTSGLTVDMSDFGIDLRLGIGTTTPTEKLEVKDGSILVEHDQNASTKISIKNIIGGGSGRAQIQFGVSGDTTTSYGGIVSFGVNATPTGTFLGPVYLPNSINFITSGGGFTDRQHINIGSRRGTDAQTRFFGGSSNFTDASLLGIFYTSGLTITDMVNTDTLRVRDGATSGYVLTSDTDGVATWQYNSTGFSGNTSGTCITDLYITNLYGCSPITVQDNLQHISSSATGINSIAWGSGTTASGDFSYSEGFDTIASDITSHAEGYSTEASRVSAHAEGYLTTASGHYSHAEGALTIASGIGSHAEGTGNLAIGKASHAEGGASKSGTPIPTSATSQSTHAEGMGTLASGFAAHAEGILTTASGDYSHAQGSGTTASGYYSHAEGTFTTSSGYASHAEGYSTEAGNGVSAHAEGYSTIASAQYSHAEGFSTIASGDGSHAGGSGSIASSVTSFIHSKNSLVTGDRSVVLGGQNITGTTDDTVYVPNLNVREDYIIHSDSVLEISNISNISSDFKGSYTEFDWTGITTNIISNNSPDGSSGILIGEFSDYPSTKNHGFLTYYGSGYTRSGSPATGTDFYRNKFVLKGSDDVDGMVINPVNNNNLAKLWWEIDDNSVMILMGGGATPKGKLGIALNEDGTEEPTANFQIGGTGTTGDFKYIDGNQQNGYVLTSDADGLASWQPSSGTTGGDGLTIDPYNNVGSATTITWDVSGTSTNYEATLTGTTTLNMSNVRNGDYGTLIVHQDGVGSRTLTFGAGTNKVVNGSAGVPTLTATAGATDILSFTYNGTIFYWTIGPDYT